MVSVSCFGVRVSVMFHLMFVHYTFSSVWVADRRDVPVGVPLDLSSGTSYRSITEYRLAS